MKKPVIAVVIALAALVAAGTLYWFVFRKNLNDRIVIPYIAHQKPRIDPHVPSAVPLADKLDEVIFDGLFNFKAGPSGIVYEDGLGEFLGIDSQSVVTVRLRRDRQWHSSYAVTMDKKKIGIARKSDDNFTAEDLRFTLRRIQALGSLSPDYILVSQAFPDFSFSGPDADGVVRFQFRADRKWQIDDIKEVLSFKIVPASSSIDQAEFTVGTGPYLRCGEYEDAICFRKVPGGAAGITDFILKPFIDNSTYTTELKNRNINVLLTTPFGAISPILRDTTDFFYKSSIATSFFALNFNTARLSLDQRKALRKLVNNRRIMDRFFKIGTPQQRHIANYRGAGDHYEECLNYSVFPTTSYYVEDTVVRPQKEQAEGDLSTLPDTVRIQTCLNFDYREELSELVEILNDPAMFHGKLKVTAVSNDEIGKGNYDAVLVVVSGYRNNFLYDLYNIFLRAPDFGSSRINLQTGLDKDGRQTIDDRSFTAEKNFFRLDLGTDSPDRVDAKQLLQYLFLFMSSHEIGDKQQGAILIDGLESKLALGAWLFSLPSLAYLSQQFDPSSVDMYGAASQLSTVGKWKERKKKK